MNQFRQGRAWVVSCAAATILASSAAAQNTTNLIFKVRISSASISSALMPPPSPLVYFRNLLAMTPQQRQIALAKKSPQIRARILAKVNEYAALDPNDRELRLRATELQWFLMPLLRASPEQRAAQLAIIPDNNIRALVKARLMEWEILPPPLQREFLDNEHVLTYFSRLDVTNNVADAGAPTDAEQSRWNALPPGKREAMTQEFNQFFELSPLEKQKALDQMPDAERAQMEKTLQAFNNLPPVQRIECVRAFGKFANMSPQERAEFLKNAQRWSQMSPAERKAWRDLVAHVPLWPPLPPAMLMPPKPPPVPRNVDVASLTNRG